MAVIALFVGLAAWIIYFDVRSDPVACRGKPFPLDANEICIANGDEVTYTNALSARREQLMLLLTVAIGGTGVGGTAGLVLLTTRTR